MRRTLRSLAELLAAMFSLDKRQRVLTIILTALALVALEWFSDATLKQFPPAFQTTVGLLTLPLIAVVFYFLISSPQPRQEMPAPSAEEPPYCKGIILFLSPYSTWTSKLPPGRQSEPWSDQELAAALNRPAPDWNLIFDYIQASNLQVPLEAVHYHRTEQTLRDVWLLTTTRSRPMAPLFEKIVRDGMGWNVEVHYDKPEFHVEPYNLESSYAAVDYVFRQELPLENLREADMIADITSGTMLMSSGMLLACTLKLRKVQFTAANNDPIEGLPLEQPRCYLIQLGESNELYGLVRRFLHTPG